MIDLIKELGWFKTNKPLDPKGAFVPLEDKDYFMVKVGEHWIGEPQYSFDVDAKLTKDFRLARQFNCRYRPYVSQFRGTLDEAMTLAKEYGGKVVRVRINIDEWMGWTE